MTEQAAAVLDAPAPAKSSPQADRRTKRPNLWHVVLLDSDDHTYEYVIEMMMKIFRHTPEQSFEIAKNVDARGRSICITTHKELAELRVTQVRGFGGDPRMATTNAMKCFMEPAESGDDDQNNNA